MQQGYDFAECIFETLREPLLVLNEQLRVESANRSFYHLFQLTPEQTLHRVVYELHNREWNIPRLRELLEEILPHQRHLENFEVAHVFGALGERVLLLNARQLDAKILLAIQDVTEERQQARRSDEVLKYIIAVVNTLREPLLVLDEQLRVVMSNQAFYDRFQVNPRETEHRLVYDLGNGQWDIPKLRELLEDILPHYTHFENFEVTHTFEDIGERTMRLNARKLFNDGEKILLIIEDITEQKQRSKALHEAQERMARQLAEIETLYRWAGVGLCVLNRDLRFARVNERVAEMNGISAADHIGKTPQEILPILAGKGEALARQVIETGRALLDIEFRGETKAMPGVERIWIEQWIPLKNERGEVIAINIVAEDVTERRRSEEALRFSESRFRMLAESIPQLIWTSDLEGRCDYLNPQWGDYTGIPSSELLGHGWVNMVHPEDEAHMWKICNAAKENGVNFILEYRLRNQLGNYRWFKVAARPLRDAQSKVVKWFGTCTDIEDQKNYAAHLERTIEERTAQLREALGELQTFSYSIAHDMRAPLRAMQGYSRILIEKFADTLEPQGAEYARRIGKAANRLDRLIQDVFSYTRVVHGTLPIERVDVDRLLRDMIAGEPEWQPPKADVAIEGTLPPVSANEAFLTQCIFNLLNNGVKFVAAGTTPWVRVRGEIIDGEVRLSFQDNGIGIAPKDQERIFNLLDRVNPDSSYEGTGLGLAIVRKAVERMNGQIGVQSEPGRGSKFWIRLKAAP